MGFLDQERAGGKTHGQDRRADAVLRYAACSLRVDARRALVVAGAALVARAAAEASPGCAPARAEDSLNQLPLRGERGSGKPPDDLCDRSGEDGAVPATAEGALS